MSTSNPTTVNDSGVAQPENSLASVSIRFFERGSIEFAREEHFPVLRDGVGPTTDIQKQAGGCELSTFPSDVIGVIIHVHASVRQPVSDGRWRVVPLFGEEFEDSLVSLAEPLGVPPHTPTSSYQGLISQANKQTKRHNSQKIVEWEPYCHYGQQLCCWKCLVGIETTRGHHRSDDTGCTIRAIGARRSCEPVGVAPARDGLAEVSSETMYENKNTTQNGCGEQSENNPWTYGEQVAAMTRWGVSGGASSRSSVLTADGSGSHELRKLLLETVDKLAEASDDQIGASIGDVIERAYMHTEHSLDAIADYLQHLMDRGIVYKPEESTIHLVDPLEETLEDSEVTA